MVLVLGSQVLTVSIGWSVHVMIGDLPPFYFYFPLSFAPINAFVTLPHH